MKASPKKALPKRPVSGVSTVLPLPARSVIARIPQRRRPAGSLHTRRLHYNEVPWPPPAGVVAAIVAACETLQRYPDGSLDDLAATIAAREGTDPERVVLGNGSNELIQLAALMTLESGRAAVMPVPAFARYAHACVVAGGEPIGVPLNREGCPDIGAMLHKVTAETRLLFCSSPHSPTGVRVPDAELRRLATALPPHVLLVLDAAYHEFLGDSAPDLLSILSGAGAPWVILRSFSKVYGLAGVRLGYALCSDVAVAQTLQRLQAGFTVNHLAMAAAYAVLAESSVVTERVSAVREEREWLAAGLSRLGCATLPSVANFLAVELPVAAAPVRAALDARGILVAELPGEPYDRYLRVTIGLREDSDALLDALGEILRSPVPSPVP